MITLAMTMGDPLMVMFGILVAIAAGAGAGYVAGTSIGKTRPATPLPTTVKLTREQLASTCSQLEKASAKLNEAEQSELSGRALIVQKKLTELTTSLGRIGHKAKQEGSA